MPRNLILGPDAILDHAERHIHRGKLDSASEILRRYERDHQGLAFGDSARLDPRCTPETDARHARLLERLADLYVAANTP